MSIEREHNADMPRSIEVYNRINNLHNDFFALAPRYNREIWSPTEAIKEHAGGCMAELLYVAGGLLYEGDVKEEDLSVRFSTGHGQMIRKGMVGDQVPDFKHVVLLINITQQQYECDFRLNRADEKPQFNLVPIEDETYESKSLEFFTFADGIREYAQRVGVRPEEIPTVADIVLLHAPKQRSYEADQVRFDEEF